MLLVLYGWSFLDVIGLGGRFLDVVRPARSISAVHVWRSLGVIKSIRAA